MHTPEETVGLRHRMVSQDPAPVPTVRATQTRTPVRKDQVSDSDVVRSTGSMAVATLMSRVTGFLRNVMITAALGGAIASAFNTANTLPNLITEIVLGAVLTSLVVPVLVRAEKEDPDRGEAFIRRLFTLASTLLIGITVLAVVGAPLLVGLPLGSESKVNVVQATSFAYLLLPQIYFYGIFALLMAVLNTKGVFRPGAWAPVVNNVITLAVLSLYIFIPGELRPHDPSPVTDPHILLLGLGTTLGVVAQALIMLPAIRRAGVSLKPLWGLDARLKQFGGMAVAIIVYVAISQLGYFITTRIAAASDAEAPNIYQQAWLLLQVPYGIIGVTLLTAIMPRLSRNAADGDDRAVVRDLVVGSKLTFIALVPIAVFFVLFGPQIAGGLFAYGKFSPESAALLGWTLTFSSFTLLPYALVLLHLRVFYAREEAWTPTFIIAGITITKVALSMAAPLVATSPARVVILLGAANGFGFLAGALIGAVLLRRKLGNLGTREVMRTASWAQGASLLGGGVALLCARLFHRLFDALHARIGSPAYLVELAVCGVVFLVITGVVLSRSGLEEVKTLGAVAGRIPGLRGKFAPVQPRILTAQESLQQQFDDTFNATPIPAPMSAGIVRGPRLVPGAEVSDGRFRLLADHGGVDCARFWQAREQASGREVALVFVDTCGKAPEAARTPAAAASVAAEVIRRTQVLRSLDLEALPNNIETVGYPNGCLIVADWIPGAPLASLDPDTVKPEAAIQAFGPLAQATAKAHDTGIPIGLDNRARIRVSTSGVAMLAFPAVLESTSQEKDAQGLRTALGSLVHDDAPKSVLEIFDVPPAELPQKIAGYGTDAEDLQVKAQATPKVTTAPGFGRANFSRGALATLSAFAVAVVVIAGVITAYLTSMLSTPEAPINRESIQGTSEPTQPPLPLVVAPNDVDRQQKELVLTFNSAPVLKALVVRTEGADGGEIEVSTQGEVLATAPVTEERVQVELPDGEYSELTVTLHGSDDEASIAQVTALSENFSRQD